MSRPSTRDRILKFLENENRPLIAQDIASNLGLTTRQVSGHLRQLVKDRQVNSQYPHKHLGERFPTAYWISKKGGFQ